MDKSFSFHSVTNYLSTICEITQGEEFSTAHVCKTWRDRCGEGYKSSWMFFFFCRYKIDHDAISLTYARLDL